MKRTNNLVGVTPVLLRFLRRETRRARTARAYPASIKGTHKGTGVNLRPKAALK